MLNSKNKHYLHVCLLLLLTVIIVFSGGLKLGNDEETLQINPWTRYGYVWTIVLYLLRLIPLLGLPHSLFNFAGLIWYNAFPDKVILKGTPSSAPFICIRVVTRGDYPQLVRTNVNRNMNKCIDAGLENFIIEVVTDKPVNMENNHQRIREIVVPPQYRTKSGALYKARALQYCLEDSVNTLGDSDWVVHLDEETLFTENSVRGILNFVMDGKHHFGQGLITYANEEVINWITTMADNFRVADDMGKLRMQFCTFHKPLFGWKGSYVVSQVAAEKAVSFDNGLDGSVAEDCYFAMRALTEGYSFNFIEGEMWEKSPFTLLDYIQQRKRWLQGILLVVHSRALPLRNKILLSISCYSVVTLPLCTLSYILAAVYPIPCTPLVDFLSAFTISVNMYMHIFGVFKSFTVVQLGIWRLMLCMIGSLLTILFTLVLENIAAMWGVFGKKHKFYIVNKNVCPQSTECRIKQS